MNSSIHAEFSVYLTPAAYAALTLAGILCAIFAATFDQSLFHRSWNTLYDFSSDNKNQFTYVVRLSYFYRKTTIDFGKTSLVLQLQLADTKDRVTIRIPPFFFEQNKHNSVDSEGGIIKFLLIRDTPLSTIEMVGITHDHLNAYLNIAFVAVQESTKNDGYMAVMDVMPIKSLSYEEMERVQMFSVSHQGNMELDGDFAIKNTDTALEFTGPIYLYLSVLSKEVTNYLVAFYQDWSNKKDFTLYLCLQRSVILSLGYFFFIFGTVSIVSDVAKYLLKGKPRSYIKVFHLINAACVLIGIVLSTQNVKELDPNNIQFVLKDANFIPYFISELWLKGVLVSILVIFLYGLPVVVIYSVLLILLFK